MKIKQKLVALFRYDYIILAIYIYKQKMSKIYYKRETKWREVRSKESREKLIIIE